MSNATPEIAVVIPYYQRQAGLLRQCVLSIIEHSGTTNFQIIVVDDESPVSAAEDLAGLEPLMLERICIIRQSNGGPGAARNRGLDEVPAGTPYVTFLDSDDQWTADFLSDAVFALRSGCDLFIGNSQRIGQKTARFEWVSGAGFSMAPEDHQQMDVVRKIYEFAGDFFDLLVYRTNVIGPTTMAYRFDKFPTVRFDPSIFNGQDRLFKLTLGQGLDRVAFSPKIYAYEGEGVNIFDKSQWGAPGSIRLASSYIRLCKRILLQIRLTSAQRDHIAKQLAEARRGLAGNTLHLLRTGRPVDWSRILSTFREDPICAVWFVPNLALSIWKRFS
ncbi:glycosyltransferase family 2 protein [Ectothiorhodospira lacustris]|uniref:glycosyltransferase family 2 protein n=1 Tax=Ectothiorhodospira lacustris TaxID=2899127 RepID=UPI001EE93013|nr:glycosyltransferase family 2 protein [Ectothiorhodospira lacustris]MCG5510347.1 glycosyltransferase [Ectothiorhodospira lacustris]MCG5522093.1 glycosyltransferase [Ectothiorhodospira lacustris]